MASNWQLLQYFESALEDLIELTGVEMGRATIERITHEHRDEERPFEIVRRVNTLAGSSSDEDAS